MSRSSDLSPGPASLGGAGLTTRALLLLLLIAGALLCLQGLWIPAKAQLAQVLLQRTFERSVAAGAPMKPWPWADTWPVARVEAPRLGAQAVVLSGASGEALAFGPGHVPGSAAPGQQGAVVYAAHRDTHFRFLGALRVGDRLEVTDRSGRRFRYRVTGMRVARWDRSGVFARSSGARLVLATCWPLDGSARGPLRYLVEARLEAS
jgi:sortase A